MPHASTPSEAPHRALVTGITGQDGHYLARQLLAEGSLVFGLARRGARDAPDGAKLLEGDVRDGASLRRAIDVAMPDEIYHLAAATFVPGSWADAAGVRDVVAAGTRHLADAIRESGPSIRVCHASSAEIFGTSGAAEGVALDETSPLAPITPYGEAKAEAHHAIAELRERHGVYACSAILFNHESPRRPPHFVTRRITRAAARIAGGLDDALTLGDLEAVRDWGFAPDYTDAMRRMLRGDAPRDYVVATGRASSVADFARLAFERVGLDWNDFVRSDASLVRPSDVRRRIGNPSRIGRDLGWHASTSLEELVRIMVDADVELVRTGQAPVP